MERLSVDLAAFRSGLAEGFEVRFPDAVVTLVLEEAEALRGAAGQRGGFSLIFRSTPGLYLPQGTYALEHPRLGRLEIFLVPIQPDAQGSLFQAIFN